MQKLSCFWGESKKQDAEAEDAPAWDLEDILTHFCVAWEVVLLEKAENWRDFTSKTAIV